MGRENWSYSGHQLLMSGIWPVITVHIPDITVHIPDITVPIPDIIFFLLSTFQTSKVDVRNMDSENWPSPIFSVHIRDITVHIPDIKH